MAELILAGPSCDNPPAVSRLTRCVRFHILDRASAFTNPNPTFRKKSGPYLAFYFHWYVASL